MSDSFIKSVFSSLRSPHSHQKLTAEPVHQDEKDFVETPRQCLRKARRPPGVKGFIG